MEQNKFFSEIHGNLGFGCMRLPTMSGAVDTEQMKQMVDAFLGAMLGISTANYNKEQAEVMKEPPDAE